MPAAKHACLRPHRTLLPRGWHPHVRLHRPWQNGKVDRMNRTIVQERQYRRAWSSEEERVDRRPPSSNTTIGSARTVPAGASHSYCVSSA